MKSKLSVILFCLMLVLVESACSPMRFSKYTGQNTVWPTSTGAMAETSYAIPIYRGSPERPYDVIGNVRFEDPRKYWDDGVLHMAASLGKARGGDALIFRSGSVVPFSWLDSFTSRPTGYGEEQTALVIKWTPDNILEARKGEEERFWANFREKFPKLASNEPLIKLVTGYLGESGVKPNSAEMENRVASLLNEIDQHPKADLGGKWLFKGTVQTKSITSSSDSQPFFGVATVSMTGNRVTLISTASRVEVNFSGTFEAGQISGTLGIGSAASSLSVKCDGVALNEKISFTFQKLVDNGTVQGSLTFQR